MPVLKSGTISKAVNVGKFAGIGFLNVLTPRGELKMFHGDHIVEIPYTRAPRPGEAGHGIKDALIKKAFSFVVPEDAAKALGVFLKETVEEETERLAQEAAEKAQADAETKAKKLAVEEAAKAEKK